ncbi:HNH endonuclease [Micrococcus luteus]|uniref:HNH endonuclease n=1 Tax=Micrococcus luteus TaxID=1270 RepID=UPI001331B093|nr:HNH endonuclease [Micrococcus luteus]
MASDSPAAERRSEQPAPVRPLSDASDEVARVVRDVGLPGLSREQWLEYAALLGQKIARLEREASELSAHFGLTSAQKRMLEYLRLHVGELVDRRALRGVAGIDDWARRVRELRVEHGWPIVSSAQDGRLPKDTYRLESLEPDDELAQRWRVANGIRKQPGSGYDRGLAYLKEIYPQAAQADEMHYVMKIASYARRVREMSEHGWMIASNIDDPGLAPGAYRLTTLEQAPPRVRRAIKLRHEVFYRDGHRCKDCGRSPAADGVVLHAHHLQMVSEGGDNSLGNLVTLCPECHAGRHAGVTAREVRDELISPVDGL